MPDVPNNATTTTNVFLGGFYYGELETVGDRDWVRIYMIEGEGAKIGLTGNDVFTSSELSDPYLRIYDRDGNLVDQNDDINTAGGNYDSQVTFAAEYSGYYYIEAAGYADLYSGGYGITATAATPPVADIVDPVDAITWGTALADTTVNVYFAPAGTYIAIDSGYGYTTDDVFNAYERAQFQAVFDQLETFTDLEFVIVTDASNADLVLGMDTDEMTSDGLLGIFNPPGETYAGNGVFNGSLWDRTAGGDLERGGYGHVTIVHELLHGLGLAHPHDNGGTSSIMSGVSGPEGDYGNALLNQGIFTTMSYNSGYASGGVNAPLGSVFDSYGYEGGAMALDIAALQALYGTGSGHNGGGTTYNLSYANLSTGGYWEAIWDTGGRDVISFDGTRSVTIDLRMASLQDAAGGGGYVSSVYGSPSGFTIANGVTIEIARGGFGDDTITGNGANNLLMGRGGNDTIDGGTGWDILRGDNGRDVLYGGSGSDTLLGQTGNDQLFGGGNNDFMQGGAGDDVMDGGFGADYMQGGNSRDRMYGGNDADVLLGEQGNDWLQGDQGADQLFGGNGSDIFIFTSASDSLNTTNRRDVIADFTRGQDRIDLSALDAGRGISGDQAFTFRGTANLQDVNIGQVRFNDGPGNSVVVAVDVDADGVGDMHILVQGVSSLNASDFIL